MKSAIIELFLTDLKQAKIIGEINEVRNIQIFKYLLLYRTARIHLAIRCRRSNVNLVSFVSKVYLDTFFIEIGRSAIIGQYFWLPHPRGIIIADFVQIGMHVHVGQYVTIGGNFKKIKKLESGEIQRLPRIGNRINIHPGAVIGGPVTMGNDIIVGANSVVTHDIPSNSIVFGQNQISKKKISIPDEGGMYTIL